VGIVGGRTEEALQRLSEATTQNVEQRIARAIHQVGETKRT
jgi:hypothetical protein